MNRKYIVMVFLLVIVAMILFSCSLGGSSTAASEEATPIPPVIETSKIVSAEAFVVPIQEVDIAFESGGRVVEILVGEGDHVEAGQILARLDNADARAAIAIAEAALVQAQATLANAKTGPTAEQIAVAEAAVDRAEANLAQVIAGPTEEEIAIAQAKVNTLQAQLNQTVAGPREEDIRASVASLKQIEAEMALAQSDYDKIAYASDSELAQPVALALQDVTLRYEAALARHEALLNGARPQEIAVVRAQLAEGQAALNQLRAGATPEQIMVAQIGVIEAEASLEQVKTGPTAEQIAVAEAGVQQAEASLAQARLTLDRLELQAPITGMVTTLEIELGQFVSAGASMANIADLSIWQIETDDLTEIDVVKVVENQPVIVQVDALPEEEFSGRVSFVKPRSETKAGDVTYTVVVELDNNNDPRLKWGMTTFVEISVE